MPWAQINLANRSYILPDPKNHVGIELPLSDYLVDILLARFSQNQNQGSNQSLFVFPGRGKTGHLVEIKRVTKNLVSRVNSLLKAQHAEHHQNILFTVHDFRRTFTTVAHELKVSDYTIHALINHKVKNITGDYIQIPLERLQAPHTRINNFILSQAQII